MMNRSEPGFLKSTLFSKTMFKQQTMIRHFSPLKFHDVSEAEQTADSQAQRPKMSIISQRMSSGRKNQFS